MLWQTDRQLSPSMQHHPCQQTQLSPQTPTLCRLALKIRHLTLYRLPELKEANKLCEVKENSIETYLRGRGRIARGLDRQHC